MKMLVLSTDYPSEKSKKLMYIHTRNLYYKKQGNDVIVLNFNSKINYEIDGINVISLKYYKKNKFKFNNYLLISHAPNIRNHYIFLKKYEKNFKRIIFFFHGHEVLKINKVYSKPYLFMKKPFYIRLIRNVYDDLKLILWRKYFTKLIKKSYFVFVSNWMYNEFIKWVKISPEILKNRYSITYNGVGEIFEKENFDYNRKKEYDFITIRTNLDGSKYSVDIVNDLAKKNPKHKFLLIGCGKFFKYNEKASNLIWLDKNLNHKEIIDFLNKSKCALMPTRTDAQGLMMCEMATYGIPVITSDIEVSYEVFDDFLNVGYINNDSINDVNLIKIYNSIKKECEKNDKYFYQNTTSQELKIFEKVMGEE